MNDKIFFSSIRRHDFDRFFHKNHALDWILVSKRQQDVLAVLFSDLITNPQVVDSTSIGPAQKVTFEYLKRTPSI